MSAISTSSSMARLRTSAGDQPAWIVRVRTAPTMVVLYVEPRSPDGGPAPAASLAAWLRRFTLALAVPAALAGFLARDIGLATSDDPPAQAGLWLTAISLGTTNSVIAVLDGGAPAVIPNSEGSRTTPSVVAFHEQGRLYVGEAAKDWAMTGRTIRSVKYPTGTLRTFADDGRDFTPQQVSAHVLEKLIGDAEDYLIEIIASAVITVPAYFDDVQQQAIREAARIAGLDVLEIIKEPAAAAFAYHLDNQEGATILVFDLGGSTLEVSLLEVRGGDVQIKATRRDDDLGGNDWDQRIADWLAQDFRNTHGTDLSKDELALKWLRESAEKAKIELSGAAEAQVTLPYLWQGGYSPRHF